MPSRLGPFDEVRDDQEIAGEFHLLDDRQLEFEPVRVIARVWPGAGPWAASRAVKPASAWARNSAASSVPSSEIGQDRLARPRPVGAAQRDLDAVARRLGQIGEKRQHFRAGLEAVLGRQLAAVVLADQRAVGDAQQRVMGVVIRSLGEIRLVGRDQRQVAAIGEVEQEAARPRASLSCPVPLQSRYRAGAETRAPKRRAAPLPRHVLFQQERAVERAARAAAERDQALARLAQAAPA